MDFIEHLYHSDIDGIQIGDLRLYCCGRRTGAPDHSFGPAARDHYWFIYLKEGSGIYEVNQHSYRLTKGTLFIAFPNRRICYKADAGSIWSISWLSIDADFLESYLAVMNITEENPVITLDTPSAVESVFTSLLSEVTANTVQSKFNCQSLIYKLLSMMTASTLPAGGQRDYIDEAVFYMTNNYDRPDRSLLPKLPLR